MLLLLLPLAGCADINRGRAGCAAHIIVVGPTEVWMVCPPRAMQAQQSEAQ